ncbi:hypothetical protein [Mycolicibacterium parafortuitum]|uniref:DUF308 domain-containing protein n=1 Tax=Mycolicibacterium parafortuitum TaxID=39692 RepID=A0A375YDA1_MYCPF|nr:hypothetical protein [Mycolicibacterium parafortuitum]ORB31067.1 hypothetical protein BST38_07110 [Mycolicibacterium parafortuitum]SRX79097.1 hypothetical protein MPP7335_00830 [Mycolicibacterium parafortuitum]
MSDQLANDLAHAEVTAGADRWLRSYYALRGAVSLVWVAAAVTLGPKSAMVAATLLLVYPAWDAVANAVDARQNGGLRRNPTQLFNAVVSTLTTAAVGWALTAGMHAVLAVFGVWAALAGLLQLGTAVRRWRRVGAQWVMVLSGAQSAFAGAMFLREAGAPAMPSVVDIAPYAAFGAFYFLVSAALLTVAAARRVR